MTQPARIEGAPRPIVCIHGYSSEGSAFATWRKRLAPAFEPPRVTHIGEYVSLTNEVSIKDIAEGFDRALRIQAGLGEHEEFDAIVHSTGMLIVRSWLAAHPQRCRRLRHLIGLAPATYGSPLAHKGRSWLGSVFKGNKTIGPDFLEAGDEILDALELGSRFTWELAHRDLFGPQPFYGTGGNTPYVFIFCGNKDYDGLLRKAVTEAGTDGTVRWAGCSLNSRKIVLDLTQLSDKKRVDLGPWHNVSNVPLLFWPGLNHGTIMDRPPDDLVLAVSEALRVDTDAEHKQWCEKWESKSQAARPEHNWQQFVVRVIDERDDPVPDYSVTLHGRRTDGSSGILHRFEDDVHSYGRDRSFKNFHLDLDKLFGRGRESKDFGRLEMELAASTGTSFVGYRGISDKGLEPEDSSEIRVDITPLLKMSDADGKNFSMFYPFTTTLAEIRIDREPLPVEKENKVYKFLHT